MFPQEITDKLTAARQAKIDAAGVDGAVAGLEAQLAEAKSSAIEKDANAAKTRDEALQAVTAWLDAQLEPAAS